MLANSKPTVLAISLVIASVLAAPTTSAQTAATPPAVSPQAAPDAAVQQIALTPAMIDQFIAAKKEIDAVLDKLPEGTDQPDPATMAKLDTVARAYKFTDYKQYDTVENNIGMVMAGIDPETKQYIGTEVVIKKQIAEIQADKKISAKDKKDTVDQLNSALGTMPKLQFPESIAVVTKAYDRLNAAMPQD